MQVVSLQAQLGALKQLAAQTFVNGCSTSSSNPNSERSTYGKVPSTYPQDLHSWLQSEFPTMMPSFDPINLNSIAESMFLEGESSGCMNLNSSIGNCDHNSSMQVEDHSFHSFEGSSSNYSMTSVLGHNYNNNQRLPYQDNDDLHSVAFGYSRH
ncbi:hypothetical protein Ancab_022417 [Ancistrocladus abbreviatus]